jgi:hypothetical protein
MARRKRFGVWWLLSNGHPWNFSRESTLEKALAVARALNVVGPRRAWIADPVPPRPKLTRR